MSLAVAGAGGPGGGGSGDGRVNRGVGHLPLILQRELEWLLEDASGLSWPTFRVTGDSGGKPVQLRVRWEELQALWQARLYDRCAIHKPNLLLGITLNKVTFDMEVVFPGTCAVLWHIRNMRGKQLERRVPC